MSHRTSIGHEWARSPRITALDGNVVMFYISALGHSAEYITEGHVARRYIAGLWHGLLDVEQGLKALEDADLIEISEDGIYLVEWAEHLLSAEEAERRRAQGRERQRRYRAKVEASRNASRDGVSDGVSNALPTPTPTPTPTRSGGGGVGASGAVAGAPLPTAPEGSGEVHANPQSEAGHLASEKVTREQILAMLPATSQDLIARFGADNYTLRSMMLQLQQDGIIRRNEGQAYYAVPR